jgi:hypothetical protein
VSVQHGNIIHEFAIARFHTNNIFIAPEGNGANHTRAVVKCSSVPAIDSGPNRYDR